MTLGGLERQVRVALNDTEDVRWSPSAVLAALVDAVRRLNSVRPESRYFQLALYQHEFPSTGGEGFDEAAARAFVLLVDPRWEQALVYYAQARCLETDSADMANQQLAADFFAKANGMMLS
jgi:hypothetical protein